MQFWGQNRVPFTKPKSIFFHISLLKIHNNLSDCSYDKTVNDLNQGNGTLFNKKFTINQDIFLWLFILFPSIKELNFNSIKMTIFTNEEWKKHCNNIIINIRLYDIILYFGIFLNFLSNSLYPLKCFQQSYCKFVSSVDYL